MLVIKTADLFSINLILVQEFRGKVGYFKYISGGL
jgi:hypothetical protein